MAYKGEDLDLRTLQGFQGSGREALDPFASLPARGAARGSTLWVDDLVLAVFNDAHELAVAHRAGQVVIEHLLNAMTRLDASAKLLEAHGVRVAALRRETGGIIASEIPVAYGNGRGNPTTSAEIDDILQVAAQNAYARRLPVGVEDILFALQESRRDIPGLAVLRRNWVPVRHREPALRLEALPPMARTYAADEPRERVRAPARSAYIAETPRVEQQQALTDTMQNSRIEALERLVRELSHDLANDRKSMGSVFGEIQRDLLMSRDDTSRFRGGLSDRLNALEQAVLSGQDGSGGTAAQLTDRLGAVERSLDLKFADLARSWTVLGDRLQALEGLLTASGTGQSVDVVPLERRMGETQRLVTALAERIGGLEKAVAGSGLAGLDALSERISTLEKAVQGGMGEGARNWAAMGDKMRGIERMLMQQAESGAKVDLAPISDRLTQLQDKVGEATRTFAQANDRVRVLEEQFGAQRASVGDLANRLGSEIKAVAAAVTAVQAAHEHTRSVVASEIATLSGSLDAQRNDMITSLAQPLDQRFAAFSAAVDRRQAESGDGIRAVAERLARLESQLTTVVTKTAETAAMRDKDLLELHEALIKINTNQQTIAQTLDQWRLDQTGDLSIVSNRLEALERVSEQPVALINRLSGEIHSMHAVAMRREQRRSRFRLWLFGTEDWYGDSWGEPGDGRPGAAAVARVGSGGSTPSVKR